jgi:hypothetical protein
VHCKGAAYRAPFLSLSWWRCVQFGWPQGVGISRAPTMTIASGCPKLPIVGQDLVFDTPFYMPTKQACRRCPKSSALCWQCVKASKACLVCIPDATSRMPRHSGSSVEGQSVSGMAGSNSVQPALHRNRVSCPLRRSETQPAQAPWLSSLVFGLRRLFYRQWVVAFVTADFHDKAVHNFPNVSSQHIFLT